MNKCLVITLPSAAAGESFPKIGELVIPFKAGTPVKLVLASNAAGNNVSINKDRFSNVASNSVDFGTSNTTVEYAGAEDCIIKIKNKYLLTRLEIATGDIDFYEGLFDYVGCDVPENIRIFPITNDYGINLDTVKNNGVRIISMAATGVSGSLDGITVYPTIRCFDSPKLTGKPAGYYGIQHITLTNTGTTLTLADVSALTTLITLNVSGSSKVTGNLSSLTSLTAISTLNVYGTQVAGSLESLGAGQVSAGRTSGFIVVTCNGIVTMVIDGQQTALPARTVKYIRFSASGYTITPN